MKSIITFGTFDIFHVGHLNILRRAKLLGSRLVVGVSSDALNYAKKGRYPIYSEQDRLAIIEGIKYVDAVFLEESLEMKPEYIKMHSADVLVMGNDWQGKFDDLSSVVDVIYLDRTPVVSTTSVIDVIKNL
jgi:glycerol-3-phosphate cytidylyltransferase